VTSTAGATHAGTGDTAWSALIVTTGVRKATAWLPAGTGSPDSREHAVAKPTIARTAMMIARNLPPRLAVVSATGRMQG
jgi:hypothetical protein